VSSARLAQRPGVRAEHTSEPLVAWRTWALAGSSRGDDLLLRPVNTRGHPWPPQEVAQARCRHHWRHRAPEFDCRCGLHASHTFDILRRMRCPAVLGRVALWGRVIEHDRGYRARFAYPQRLRLICQFCFWQHGPLANAPTVVGSYPHRRLVPLCDEHLSVSRELDQAPQHVLDAPVVDQRLRDTYAVDLLAV
jgi:hypothetical protein